MTARQSLALICLVATLHGLFFIWYQRPDWYTQWSDQEGYRRLGAVLATTGKFTRFPDSPRFVPEVIRTPLYPAVVALVYRLFGASQVAVALTQTLFLALIVVLVWMTARLIGASEGVGLAAAAAVALFPPLPYFAALVMTEVWTTLMFTATIWMGLRAIRSGRTDRFALTGALIALTTLSRPVFVLFPFALAAMGIISVRVAGAVRRPPLSRWAVMIGTFALVMLPWFAYNYVTLGRFTLSPAGGIGRGLWEGEWQATWSGRVQNELTHLADEVHDRAELDRRVRAVAERERTSSAPMLTYVHQWQDIRRIWDTPTDPFERAQARVAADEEYRRVAIENLKRDSAAHLAKRLARGVFILWAGEIPFRYSDINALPRAAILLCWAVQAALFCLAIGGIAVLARGGRPIEACVLATPILYITAVHFPLLTEARQSLPAQPTVVLLAAVAVAHLTGRSFPLEAQVHEREHL
jgi:Dolichyl-phosphate-mannose-protein mannosyltransferase